MSPPAPSKKPGFALDSDALPRCILWDVAMHRLRLLIQGRVQGVGFRYFVLEQARLLGLAGQVRNRPDGAVEVEAEGEPEVLRRLVDAARRGPRSAWVAQVDEDWSEGPARHRGFTIT